jgi:hypothetical protein
MGSLLFNLLELEVGLGFGVQTWRKRRQRLSSSTKKGQLHFAYSWPPFDFQLSMTSLLNCVKTGFGLASWWNTFVRKCSQHFCDSFDSTLCAKVGTRAFFAHETVLCVRATQPRHCAKIRLNIIL